MRGCQAALRDSEARLQRVLSVETVGVMFWDLASGVMIDANDAFLKLMGYSRREVKARKLTWQKLTPPEFMEVSRQEIRRFITTGRVGPYEKEYFRKDGTRRWFVFAGSTFGKGTIVEFCVDISDRKEAEARLRQSEERLALATSGSRMGMFEWNMATDQLLWNEQHARLMGLPTTKTTTLSLTYHYRDWAERVHPEDLPRMQAEVRRCLDQHLPLEAEYRVVWPDQSVHWLFVRGVFHHDARGVPERMLGMVMDITERKATEAALRESEERLRFALETSHVGAWDLDLVDHTAFHSLEHDRIFGYSELLPRWTYELFLKHVLPEDRAAVDATVKRAIATKCDCTFECRVRRAGGEVRWIWVAGRQLPDASGTPRRLAGIVQDITERKTSELARARLAAIVESSTDAIFAIDLDGVITDWPPGAERLYGYSAAEAVGKPWELIVPQERQSEIPLFTEKLRRGELIISYETVRVRKDGHQLPVSITVSPLRDAAGQIIGASSIGRDITERKRLEQQLLEVGEREQQRIGHDLHDGLGQELHALFYLARLLEDELKLEVPARAPEAGRLARVLEHTLALTRNLARGLQPVTPVPEGLMQTLRELAGRTQDLYGVDCRFECRKPVLIHEHRAATHLYRIAQEAVNNAMKHARPSRILLRLAATPRAILLSVRDNGIGIRRKNGRRPGGMGMHIMQYRAEAVRGSLVVRRLPEGGTEVVCSVACKDLLRAEEVNHGGNKK